MHHSIPEKLGVLEPGDHSEHTLLLAPRQVRLESDKVVCGQVGVLGPELHRRPRPSARAGVGQPHRLQGTEPERIPARPRYLLDRLARAEEVALLELLGDDALRGDQLVVEALVLLSGHRAVEVVTPALFVVARLREHNVPVQRLRIDDWRCGIIEREGVATDLLGNR